MILKNTKPRSGAQRCTIWRGTIWVRIEEEHIWRGTIWRGTIWVGRSAVRELSEVIIFQNTSVSADEMHLSSVEWGFADGFSAADEMRLLGLGFVCLGVKESSCVLESGRLSVNMITNRVLETRFQHGSTWKKVHIRCLKLRISSIINSISTRNLSFKNSRCYFSTLFWNWATNEIFSNLMLNEKKIPNQRV